jgi:hypothetical protein
MFTDWQNQQSKNDYTTKSNLHVQGNSHQNPNEIENPITEIEKSILKFIWKHKRPQIGKAILRKKEQCWSITIPNFNLHYRDIAIKTTWYWHKNRYDNQWNRVEALDMSPCSHGH